MYNTNIDVSGKGFRGGRKSPNYPIVNGNYGMNNYSFFFSTDFNFFPVHCREEKKGEGIASLY